VQVATGISGLQYIDKSVTARTTYYYVLTGTGNGGESEKSPEFQITP
jgi:hypothetical protein